MRHSRHRGLRPALAALPLLAAALVTACGGGSAPGPAAVPVPAPPAPALFAYAPGERHALFESRATVHVAGDTSAVTDTIVTRLHATLLLAPGATPTATTPGALTGTVDSVVVDAGARAGAGTPPLAAPIPFTGTVDGGTVRLSIPPAATTDCASPSGTYLAIARDLLPSLPARLAPGTSWSETVTTTSCRGGVVLTTTASHRYVVQDTAVSHDGRPATRITRTTSYHLVGDGAQAGVSVKVQGDGTGDGEIMVDAAAGEFLTSTAHSTLNMTFDAAGRVQRVVQDGVQSVRVTISPGA